MINDTMELSIPDYISLLLESLGGPVLAPNKRIELIEKCGKAASEQVAALLLSHIAVWQAGGKPHDSISVLCLMLGHMKGDIARDTLLSLAGPNYGNSSIPTLAGNGLELLKDAAIVEPVIGFIQHPSTSNRPQLYTVLRSIPEALPPLVAALDYPPYSGHDMHSPAKLLRIVQALAVRGDWDETTVRKLLKITRQYGNGAVRAEALAAIGAAIPRSFKPDMQGELLDEVLQSLQETAVSDGDDTARAVAVSVAAKVSAWRAPVNTGV